MTTAATADPPPARPLVLAGRVAGRALWWTAWWGLPLLALALLTAIGLPDLRGLVALAVATWVSYAVHEAGHAWCAVRAGTPAGDVRLRRRGAGLEVSTPVLPARTARQTAVAGVVAGVTSGVVAATGVLFAVAGHLSTTPLALVTGAVAMVHLVNLLPGTPDGRHIWPERQRLCRALRPSARRRRGRAARERP